MKGAIAKANKLVKEIPNSVIPGQFVNKVNPFTHKRTTGPEIYDEIITVKNEDAFASARLVGQKEGFLVGISSGAALTAAIELAKRKENKNKNIVVIFLDNGERYLSTVLFEE